MRLEGGIHINQSGLTQSIQAMHVQTELMSISSENVTGFDKIGYQRKEPVVSALTEYIGIHGLSNTVDDQVGRIITSRNPLDIAMANKGYFQIQTPHGVKLTRDGRFKYDKLGNLLNLEDQPVLSDAGMPIRLPVVPSSADEVVVDKKGKKGSKIKEVNKDGLNAFDLSFIKGNYFKFWGK